jgi:hypothetical protein
MTPGTVKLRESLRHSRRIYVRLSVVKPDAWSSKLHLEEPSVPGFVAESVDTATAKAPTSKHQAPEKLQASTSKPRLKFGHWSFSGA